MSPPRPTRCGRPAGGARRAELASKLGADRGAVHWTSATKGTGIPELRALVTALLQA